MTKGRIGECKYCGKIHGFRKENCPAYENKLTKEQLVSRFPNMLADGIGKLDGNYHIRLDTSVDPVQHAPIGVPVALRSKLQTTLNEMVDQDLLAPVTTPTPWISSMVVVPKKNGKLRIFLDLKDLNAAFKENTIHFPPSKTSRRDCMVPRSSP